MTTYRRILWRLIPLAVAIGLLAFASPASAQLRLRDICRVKGQEENTLQGLGLVVGLKGTGDAEQAPTARALATMMKLMGQPLSTNTKNQDLLEELKDARNVALVFVSATVPAAGARQGDKINCRVSAINAKSLDGGQLVMTPLLGPRPGSERVYAFAQGSIHVGDASQPATGTIHQGCRLEEDVFNSFSKEKKITLVLFENHAGFETAQEIADLVNTQSYFQSNDSTDDYIAKAIDQVNIEVRIPEHYADDPVLFVSQILSQPIRNLQTEARVVINQRAGTVVIGGNVEIGAVVVTHKGMVIDTGTAATSDQFVPVDPSNENETKLKTLVDALNAIKASDQDIIEIIKGLDRDGKLYARLIIE